MAGLFSAPPAPQAPPGPDPALLKRQQDQEDRLARQERAQQQELSARRRARGSGGTRQLIFQARIDPALGVPTDTSLGPASTPRNPDRRTS